MNRTTNFIVCIVMLSALVYGCNSPTVSDGARLSDERPGAVLKAPGPTDVLLNGYQVHYDGRSYDSVNDQTTFSYTVSGTGVPPDLSRFHVEIPDCDPAMVVASTVPSRSFWHLDPGTGLSGIMWSQRLGSGDTRSYSLTLDGIVFDGTTRALVSVGNNSEGMTHSILKVGSGSEVGDIAGPTCIFDVSGTVFVDADEDTNRDSTESGIAGVTVVLKKSGLVVASVRTDADGDYLFADQPVGSYVVEINTLTSDPGDFNEQLFGAFVGDTATAVTIGPDSPNNDFDFLTNAEEIVLDLNSGELEATGLPAKFWRKELRRALHYGNGNPTYTPEEMLGFLVAINGLFLEDPFQFDVDPDPLVGFSKALAILKNNPKSDIDRLRKELLATEFNEVSGKLIVDAGGLQGVLISWGEALVAAELGLPVSGTQKTAISLSAAADVFSRLNESSGGGTPGG